VLALASEEQQQSALGLISAQYAMEL
jgi:hypothetical protein